MSLQEILVLAFALAIDAMIVSFSYGFKICENKLKNSLKLAFFFGFFQFLMPLVGWFLTGYIYDYLKVFSKWIVFVIFMILGLKFLIEAFFIKQEEKTDCISYFCIISLAIATSIDALGAGVSLRLLNTNIIESSVIIGVITFLLSEIGFHFGNIFCKFSEKYIDIIGAFLLIYLAVKAVFI